MGNRGSELGEHPCSRQLQFPNRNARERNRTVKNKKYAIVDGIRKYYCEKKVRCLERYQRYISYKLVYG